MSWLDLETSFYSWTKDTVGTRATFRNIIRCEAPMHIEKLRELKALDLNDPDYEVKKYDLKKWLPLYAPSALMETRKKGSVIILRKTGLMQIDIDYKDNPELDMEVVKHKLFKLPFVALSARSCSGKGIYAFIAIDEPDRLAEYYTHIRLVLKSMGINLDTTKGNKYQDLRYVSWDSVTLINEYPQPLRVRHFQTIPDIKRDFTGTNVSGNYEGYDGLIKAMLNKVKEAKVNHRWETIQKVAFTLGGIGDESLLQLIIDEINSNSEFNGLEYKYEKCAVDCFTDGMQSPLDKSTLATTGA